MPNRTNRFEHIEGSHFQRMRIAFLELVRMARQGNALTEGETRLLEQIAIGFVTREIEMRVERGRHELETLELAREQLVELSDDEVQTLRNGLGARAPDEPDFAALLDQFREPLPRVFLRFETPEQRAKRAAERIRGVLGQPSPIELPPEGRQAAVSILTEASRELSEAFEAWQRMPRVGDPAGEQQALTEIITRAAYLWSALRFK